MRTRILMALLAGVLVAQAGAAGAQVRETVERPIAGDLGMSFIFGGLGSMAIGGPLSYNPGRLFFAEVGMKYMVADKWALPFSFGLGLHSFNPSGGESQNDVGMGFTIGLQRYFRVSRRIAPYFGAKMHMHYNDRSGSDNYLIQIALGPLLGVEYFIGDRVSLGLEYALLLAFQFENNLTQIGLQSLVSHLGQMALTFYF